MAATTPNRFAISSRLTSSGSRWTVSSTSFLAVMLPLCLKLNKKAIITNYSNVSTRIITGFDFTGGNFAIVVSALRMAEFGAS